MFISPNPFFRLFDTLPGKKNFGLGQNPWTVDKEDQWFLFSRGQWALTALGTCLAEGRGRTKGRIFIPEYFCEISLTPLRRSGFDLHFYRLTPNFLPEVSDLDRMVEKYGSPEMLLFVHYFGFPLDIGPTGIWCRNNKVLLVEDAAHSLLPVPGIGRHGYPVIYTPWKFLNTPGGAFLVLPGNCGFELALERERENGSAYPWAWMVKQLIHRSAQHLGLPLYKMKKPRVKEEDESEPILDPGDPACAVPAKTFLSKGGRSLSDIGRIRERNYRRIDQALVASTRRQGRLFPQRPEGFTPYVYPFRIGEGRCRKVMVALNRTGIPAMTWSDLSPEVKNSEEYPLANALRREVMVLPVHQDLTLAQLDWMTDQVNHILSAI